MSTYRPPDANAKVSCAPTIFDEGLVYFGRREQTRTSMRVERYEINRRIVVLKNQVQSRRLIFEHTLHNAGLVTSIVSAQALAVACAVSAHSIFYEELR